MAKNNLKNKNGITLLALVITIIIIAILAGVTLLTLTGEERTIERANLAKEKTNYAADEEQIIRAYNAAKIVGNGKEVSRTEFTKELKKYDKNVEVTGNDEEGYVVTFETGTVYTIQNGKVVNTEIMASNVTAENYGDTVNYTAPNGLNNWKIFYNDGNNVFLILSDCVENKYLPKKDDIATYNDWKYLVFWNWDSFKRKGAGDIDKTIAERYKMAWLEENNSANGENTRATATLLESIIWEDFVNVQFADSAIGSPTLDMWVDSWNEKGEIKGYNKLYCDFNSTGYYISTQPESKTTEVSLVDTAGYSDSLYFPSKQSKDNCDGYWLSAPSATGTHNIMKIKYTGTVDHLWYYATASGIRPVVCLKSNLKGTKVGNSWILEK